MNSNDLEVWHEINDGKFYRIKFNLSEEEYNKAIWKINLNKYIKVIS